MGVRELRKEIRAAMMPENMCAGAQVTAKEEQKFEAATLKDHQISPAEGREWEKLLGKAHVWQPGFAMTEMCPEHSADYVMIDEAALKSANAMFVQHGVPYGENKAKIRSKIINTLETVDHGKALAQAPSTRGLHEVFIDDHRMVDGARRDAYLDATNHQFYLKVTGSGMGGPQTVGPFWYGPLALDHEAGKSVKDSTVAKLKRKVAVGIAHDSLKFEGHSLPLGERFVRVHLFAEKHPEGYSYEAAIPVGALAPGAPTSDPNKAKQFYVVRTGGIAGFSEVAGPMKL